MTATLLASRRCTTPLASRSTRPDVPLRLALPVAAQEAALPRPAPLPDHGDAVAAVQIVELDLRPLRRVRRHGRLPAGEVGEQSAGREVPRAASGNVAGAGAGEQHRRLAAAVRSGQHGDGVLKRKPEIPDAAQLS